MTVAASFSSVQNYNATDMSLYWSFKNFQNYNALRTNPHSVHQMERREKHKETLFWRDARIAQKKRICVFTAVMITAIGERRHSSIGPTLLFVNSSQRRRAIRGEGLGTSSEGPGKGEKDDEEIRSQEEENETVQDELDEQLQENMKESISAREKSKQEAKEISWFWRKWWSSRPQNESENIAADVVEGTENSEGRLQSEIEGLEKGETQESSAGDSEGDAAQEVDLREKVVENGAAAMFWRKFWRQEEIVEDDPLGPEDRQLMQDLETLIFRWKDLLDPTFENVLALSLTALLTLAILKILWQLFVVVITIIISAFKYTVLAVLLVGLLIFLL